MQTVRAWVQAQNMALKSGDMAALGRLSARECKTCEQLVAPIREVYDAGGRFETKGWVVEAAKVRDPGAQPEEVDAALTITAGRTFPTSTGEPVVYEEDKRILRFTLVREGGQRVVSFVGFLS